MSDNRPHDGSLQSSSVKNKDVVLLTGGTGFLGAYIIKNLIEKGHAVRSIRHSATLPFFISKAVLDKVEWLEGDIMDIVGLEEAMRGIHAVVHSAALVSFAPYNRAQMNRVNVEGTANVVNAALEAGVKRFLHVSSVAALGRTGVSATVTEEKAWEENKNNTYYAVTKHRAEIEVWRGFAEGLGGAIINPATILGFGNWHQSSCAIFRNGYKGFPWYTKGVNGFVGVEDVAEAAVRILFSEINEERFIVAAENRSFQQLMTAIAESFKKNPPHRYAGPFLSGLAWRAESIKHFITGSRPLVTKETARIAHNKTSFASGKLLQALPGFEFTELDDVIKEAGALYLKAIKKGELTL